MKLKPILASVLVLAAGLIGPLALSIPTPAQAEAVATNLILNPSFETATSATVPQNWLTGKWGTNTVSFSYPSDGQDGSRSARLDVTKYTSGDAKWYFKDVNVQPSTKYNFNDYYKSNVATRLVAQITSTTGSLSYVELATLPTASTWTPVGVSLTTPATAKSLTIFHLIASGGWLQVDNYSFGLPVPPVVTPPPAPTPIPTPVPTPAPTPTPPPVPGGGLVPNNSVETVSSATAALPQDWLTGGWGTNTTSLSYLPTGHTGNRSLKTQITNFSSGDAKWYFTLQAVTPNQAYDFSDYYQADIGSDVVAMVLDANGAPSYQFLGHANPSSTWASLKLHFTTPASAKTLTIFHLIAGVGTLVTDDYSLSATSSLPFNRALISLTFDDGWQSQYPNALPLLKQFNMPATFYLISNYTGAPYYMTAAQVNGLKAAGEELADHTATHPDLTTLTLARLNTELAGSKATLQNTFGVPITDFASPYGSYNDTVIGQIKLSFQSHRSTDVGFNTRANFNPYNIQVQNIVITTTQAEIDGWIATAKAQNSWLVLVYHEVGSNVGGGAFHTDIAQLQATLSAIATSGVQVKTVAQALAELQPQLP